MSSRVESIVRDRRGGAAVIIVAVLAIAAIAFAIYWFAIRGGGGGGATEKLALQRIPASAQVVGGLDVQEFLKSDFLKSAAKQRGVSVEQLVAQLGEKGVDVSKIASLAFGAQIGEAGPKSVVALADGSFDAQQLSQALGAAQGALMGAGAGEVASPLEHVQVVDGHLVLAGSGALYDEAVALAGGNGKSIADDAAIADLRSKVDTGATFWVSGVVPDAVKGQFKAVARMASGLGVPTHFALSGDVGSGVAVRIALRFDNDVEKAVSQIQGMLSFAKAAASGPEGEVLDSLSLDASGQVLVAKLTIPDALIQKMASQAEQSPPL
ncbi:MAG: hypothetical protein KC635_09130 [Myxococcales bacterium]|nr:hypothetical protein [Myxococcales bacterium]MCB9736345.1 hypothetical protein [Deltaproteobacteria bacterium]